MTNVYSIIGTSTKIYFQFFIFLIDRKFYLCIFQIFYAYRQNNRERCRNPSQVFDEAGEILVNLPKEVLGRGAFGEVLLGTFENDQCAVKRQRVENDRRISDIKREIRTIRSKCNHRNIIRYFCSQKHSIDDNIFVDIDAVFYTRCRTSV